MFLAKCESCGPRRLSEQQLSHTLVALVSVATACIYVNVCVQGRAWPLVQEHKDFRFVGDVDPAGGLALHRSHASRSLRLCFGGSQRLILGPKIDVHA